MTIYKAGNSQSQYIERNTEELRCICYERGDRNVFVDGVGPYCLILEKEYFKISEGDVGVNSEIIEAYWLKDECLPIEARSVIRTGNHEYKVKGDPVDMCDGWISAKLKFTCICQ